jgi:hypothetical protein
MQARSDEDLIEEPLDWIDPLDAGRPTMRTWAWDKPNRHCAW